MVASRAAAREGAHGAGKRRLRAKVFGRKLGQFVALAASVCAAASGPQAWAQVGAGPSSHIPDAAVPPPVDRPFDGVITLMVDATDVERGIFSVEETIPVRSVGDMVLLYPEWETGSHAPTGTPIGLAGLVVRIDGRRVEWRRDPVDMHAFHVSVPSGARTAAITFQYLPPASAGWLRPEMIDVQWQRLLLYPAGWFARDLAVQATLRLPHGMRAFTSLDRIAGTDDVRFATTSLERLVDAPVYAGGAWREIDLAPGAARAVRLDVLADDPADLVIDPLETDRLRALVAQATGVFGTPPFRHYDMLMTLSDVLSPGGGIEHLEEGENNLPARYLLGPNRALNDRDLVAHEFVHAWNGRFRQPADLWTPNFNQPAGASLLWVYEGQTEFWGRVLAARSGLRSTQDTLDKIALDAALVANRPGRAWKSLADSTNDAIYMAGRSVAWRDEQRREDYYPEGVLLWLDVEARLRSLSDGRIGLDDFARRFFHADRPDGVVSTYTFDDVCRTLDGLAHDDWKAFLDRHLDTHEDADALAGLAHAGWRLVYRPIPSETFRQDEAEAGGANLTYSVGAVVEESGRVAGVAWNGPAFRAGLVPGARILSVDGMPFTLPLLLQAVADTPDTPLRLEVVASGRKRDLAISYGDGARYPWLERIDGTEDRLTPLLNAR